MAISTPSDGQVEKQQHLAEIERDLAQIPPEMRQSYLLAKSAYSPDEVTEKIEAGIRGGAVTDLGEFKNAVLAMRFLGDEESANRRACEAVRRSLHYQNPTFLTRASWEHEKAAEILAQVDSSFADFYKANYGGVVYDQMKSRSSSAAHLDEQTRIAEGKTTLDVATIKSKLAGASPRALAKMADFLIGAYESGTLASIMEGELKDACSKLSTPAHIAAFAGSLDRANGPYLKQKIPCLESARTFISRPENTWRAFVWWNSNGQHSGSGEISRAITTAAVQDIPSKQRVLMAQSFLREPDLVLCDGLFGELPSVVQGQVVDMLLDSERLLDDRNLAAKLVVCMRGNASVVKDRLPGCLLGYSSAASKPGLDELVGRAGALMKTAGLSDVDVGVVKTAAEKAFLAKEATGGDRAKARAARIAVHEKDTKGKVDAALSADALREAGAGKLSREDFEKAVRAKVEALKLPADFGTRVVGINGQKDILVKEATGVVSDEELLVVVFGTDAEKKVDTEPGSFISRMGVSAVRFKRGNGEGGIKVELDLRGDEKGPATYEGVGIGRDGKISFPGLPHDVPGLAEMAGVEIARLFYKMVNEGRDREGCDHATLLMVLGLMEYFDGLPPEVAAEPAKAGAEAAPEAQRELTPLERTKIFLAENYAIFESFMRSSGVSVPGRFEDIVQIFTQLQCFVRVNKAIPPGGIRVVPPPAHAFGNCVPVMDFYNIRETREILERLKIDPKMFHGAEDHIGRDGQMDAYFGRVHLNSGTEGETSELTVCIFPPNFDVYIIGVDTASILTGGDNAQVAFLHMILESFRMAVMRNEDPANTRSGVPGGGSSSGSTLNVKDVVTEVTRAQFPPIVVDWNTPGCRIRELEETAEGADASGVSIGKRLAIGRRVLVNGKFEDIWTSPGEAPAVLASHGTFLPARDYIRLVPKGADIFPQEAFWDGAKRTELKDDYAVVYVPLDEAVKVKQVIDIMRDQRLVGKSKIRGTDPETWFADELRSAGVAAAPQIFRMAMTSALNVSGQLSSCAAREFRRAPGKVVDSYETLFNVVLQRAKVADSSVTEQDVFSAFARMSPVNPDRVFLATSGAADYRLPYKFRENTREKPDETVFEDTDFDVPPTASSDVVSVIAGNRVAMSDASDSWLRGDNRSSVMDFAAGIQNPYRQRNNGSEISLKSRARAMMVWEFVDGTHAFTYLDAARDSVDPVTLNTIVPAPAKLQILPRVNNAVRAAVSENTSHVHTDFSDITKWSTSELLRLEREGVVILHRTPGGRVVGIASAKHVERKKIAIIREESVGYRQFQVEPTTLAEYQKWGHTNGNDIGTGLPYDPKIALIQSHFYEMLGM